MRNKKIANLTFKEPFDILSKIEDKSDFLSVRGLWDEVLTYLMLESVPAFELAVNTNH